MKSIHLPIGPLSAWSLIAVISIGCGETPSVPKSATPSTPVAANPPPPQGAPGSQMPVAANSGPREHGAAAVPGSPPAAGSTPHQLAGPAQMANMAGSANMPGSANMSTGNSSPSNAAQMAQMAKSNPSNMPSGSPLTGMPKGPSAQTAMADMMKNQPGMAPGGAAGNNGVAKVAAGRMQQGGSNPQNMQASASGSGGNPAAPGGRGPGMRGGRGGGRQPPASAQVGGANSQAQKFKPGSADEAVFNFCTAIADDDTANASDNVSSSAKGLLAQMRDGELSEEKIEEIKDALTPMSELTPTSAENPVATRRSLRNGKNQTISFTLKKEKDAYKIIEFALSKPKKSAGG